MVYSSTNKMDAGAAEGHMAAIKYLGALLWFDMIVWREVDGCGG